MTTLDSATRLLRYNIAEISQSLKLEKVLGNRIVASGLAVAAIAFFAFYEVGGSSAGLALWELFGTTNQLLAALALLVVTALLATTQEDLLALLPPDGLHVRKHADRDDPEPRGYGRDEKWLLFTVGSTLLVLALWLAVEAILCLRSGRSAEGLDIDTR